VKGGGQDLKVLLDEGTPILSATPFLSRGHQVIYHRDVLDNGARDELVAVTAILNNAVLIAIDLDMKKLVRRFGSPSNEARFNKLDLIFVGCDAVMAAKRLDHAMSSKTNGPSGVKSRRGGFGSASKITA
jgi:hypothetical protein